MTTVTKTLSVYIRNRDEDIDIDVDCECEVTNDGIGPYEYWGQKCFDKGTDYLEIINTDWDRTGFSKEEIDFIESEIERKKSDWEGEIEITSNIE